MIGAIEDINLLPFKKILKKNDLLAKRRFSFYLNKQKNLSTEKKDEEFPVDEWKMPVEPQGYIKSRNNDLL